MEILPVSSAAHLVQPSLDQYPPPDHHKHNRGSSCHSFIIRGCVQQAIHPASCLSTTVSRFCGSACSWRKKEKVVFVLGSSGTGKSKLAIDLAIHFGGEVVNSDKMQVYAGLNIITNKVTEEECGGIPHHLIGGVHPDSDFTASDFCREASRAVESIVGRGRVPIIAGGSNSYIEELVEGNNTTTRFRSKYECCFVWVDVELSVLHSFVSERVDKMVEMGLVEEARGMFDPAADYTKGIRRSIGIAEMDRYLRAAQADEQDQYPRQRAELLLEEAIKEIKENTCKLTCRQLHKIHRLSTLAGWDVQRVDATQLVLFMMMMMSRGGAPAREAADQEEEYWKIGVFREATIIVDNFLKPVPPPPAAAPAPAPGSSMHASTFAIAPSVGAATATAIEKDRKVTAGVVGPVSCSTI